jgi:crotonobetainyl-CoA:carnitine CoA-transferase CaiB-like acyl-CoA transferase
LLLADLGADVVKIERAGRGDDSRQWGPPFLNGEALWYLAVNRNKRSVALDFADPADVGVLTELAGAADVVITTLREPLLRRLGLDYATVSARRPDLVFATITGYGLTGPNSGLPGYDLIAEGVSGIMAVTGEPTTGPQKVGAPAADILAGMDAAFAVVAALYDRARTGRGHLLDLSLVESMTRMLSPKLMSYLGSGELQRRSGGRDSVVAIYQAFDTADEPINLALGNDAIFERFCTVMDRQEWSACPDYRDNSGRRDHRTHLVTEIQKLLLERTAAEWLELYARADVPAGPVNNLEAVVTDPHLLERGLFYRHGDGDGAIPQVNTGWQLDGAANRLRRRPPALGADTADVLADWLVPGTQTEETA